MVFFSFILRDLFNLLIYFLGLMLIYRRFSYGHLAQLKHILPEAIEVKRMLIFDERTSCMKLDLHVSIIVDVIDCRDKSKSATKNLNLRRAFRARLADYLKAHPEVFFSVCIRIGYLETFGTLDLVLVLKFIVEF